MGLFGRHRGTPSTAVAPDAVPATPAERLAAISAALVERGLGGAAAQGVPLPAGPGFGQVLRLVEHLVPDAGERRVLCRRMAEDLQSMLRVEAVDVDEVLDVLGATSARLAAHQVPRRLWVTVRGAADDALGLARETGSGEGDLLDRWGRDDAFVLDTLAVLLIVFSRLAV
ncbi:MAG TPA: hypothetical protein VEV65_02920 [Kineosporiaceae bacterium]|nr:hypothetical protein [Kineosporiaceae bacterium]